MLNAVVDRCAWLVALLVFAGGGVVQPQPRGAGHWQGAIQAQGQELKLEVDLIKAGDKWDGAMAVPAQSLKGLPPAVTVEGDTVTFTAKIPGDPQFKGKLSTDGQSLSGDFTQFGNSMPLNLTRSGDGKIDPLPKSTPISNDLEGSWEGTLDVKGKLLRLALKLSNQPGGAGTGVLVSIDQGGVEIPIAAVVQTGVQLKLLIPAVAGSYDGALKDGVLTGTWTQGPLTLPLVFKRSK